MRRNYLRLASLACLALGLLAFTFAARAGEEKKGEKGGEEKKGEKKGEGKKGEDSSDQAKLQGTWELTKQAMGGKEFSGEGVPPLTLIVKDDLMTRTLGAEGKGAMSKSRFKLDAQKKPKEITLTDEGPVKGAKVVGIYELKGDTLTLATSPPGVAMRPKGFSAKEAGMTIIMTFKRAKKK
jgi:uncharacterized protein (TIGR03067 family)